MTGFVPGVKRHSYSWDQCWSCWELSAMRNKCEAFLDRSTSLTARQVSVSPMIRHQCKPTDSVLKFMKIINSRTIALRKAKSILEHCLNLSFHYVKLMFPGAGHLPVLSSLIQQFCVHHQLFLVLLCFPLLFCFCNSPNITRQSTNHPGLLAPF